MAKSNIKVTLPCNIKEVWDAVTNLEEYSWRSGLDRIKILNDRQFVEYTKDGYSTNFSIIESKPYERWEFTMENGNMKGRWIGIFKGQGDETTVDLTEDVVVKKFYMKPFAGRYLKSQQLQYINDLKKKLGC